MFHKCRLCLKIGDFCSIFEKDDNIKLSDMVMSFANVKIHEGDGFSDRVCASCIEHLSTSYLFKQQCERIDALLRKQEADIDKPPTTDFNEFCEKEFLMHSTYASIESENNDSLNNDNSQNSYYSVSDETDSDIESIKCVYCSQSYGNVGGHRCHVTCTIENNELQHSSSNETLVASDMKQPIRLPEPVTSNFQIPEYMRVSCVLCDEVYDQYDDYIIHLNKCTTNVKLHHYVCPVCHELFTAKLAYLEHLRVIHFKVDDSKSNHNMSEGTFYHDISNDSSFSHNTSDGVDCVDFAPMIEKTSKPKAVRRQIGWSIEDIYQEIECKKVDVKPAHTSSPIKNFFSKLGNESFSRQSTPKKVSFRKFIENGKAKTSVYIPFRKIIQNYKDKRKTSYSPIVNSKTQVVSTVQATYPEIVSDSDYGSPSGTSEDSWKMKQTLICACDKKIFMLSEFIHDRDRITAMINELGGVVAANTKMEMLATHFISVLPNDTFTGMMVCALATGKSLLHISFVYDSFRCKKFLQESMYEWLKHPKIVEIDNTSVEVAKAAIFWYNELKKKPTKFPFEGKQIVLIMKKKYRQYYQMVFKTLKAKPVTYDPRTPGSCCSADYCFVDMKIIERVKLRFFFHHNVPVFPYQYILVYLLKRGRVDDEHKYLLQDCKLKDDDYFLNSTC
ncbi:unnamed protein product [Pieris macdunnoughi]|uniref:ZAD domain-containing protein n=1 Tax=Pieris macdunnoughi TaxID=345717 RepID=A0A821TY60_9NEOP|nr:unnamed protein product [Pieris macdunnoughi]